eukprot:402158-Pelagomonas_calceolata.AAC.1
MKQSFPLSVRSLGTGLCIRAVWFVGLGMGNGRHAILLIDTRSLSALAQVLLLLSLNGGRVVRRGTASICGLQIDILHGWQGIGWNGGVSW